MSIVGDFLSKSISLSPVFNLLYTILCGGGKENKKFVNARGNHT